MSAQRPKGLTIICIWLGLKGVILLIIGIALVVLSFLNSSYLETSDITGSLKPLEALPVYAILISIAIASIVIPYGLLGGKSWAWIAAIVLSFVELAMGVIGIITAFILTDAENRADIVAIASVSSVVINGIILGYLHTPGVKKYINEFAQRREQTKRKKSLYMPAWMRRSLLVYFAFIIAGSLFVLVYIWNPVESSLQASKTENVTISGQGRNVTTIITKNQTVIATQTITSTLLPNNTTQVHNNVTIMPVSGQAFRTDPEYLFTNREVRLVLLSLLFGVLGAATRETLSLTAWRSRRKLERSYALWYLSRPVVGAALAIITYMILRAGLISGGPANVSDFGVVSISALVGIMSVPMSEKLRDIFNELFGIRKTEVERGESPEKKYQPRIKISALKTEVKVGEELTLEVDVNKSDGSPADKIPVHFAISDSAIAQFTEDVSKKETDDKGALSVKIKGNKKGDVDVTVTTTIEEEEMEEEVTGRIKASDTIKIKVYE